MTEVIESLREQDTYDLGTKLGENCKPGDITSSGRESV